MAMLRWRCRRGMRELDVAMLTYLEQVYPGASTASQQAFERLLPLPDPDLFAWLTAAAPTPDEHADAIDALRRALTAGA